MTPNTKRTDSPHPIAFRLPEIARQQLDELMSRWGENQSQAIIRCIERGWMSEKNQIPMPAPRVNWNGSTVFSQKTKEMEMSSEKQLASLLSIDRNIEVALYPAGIEVRVSARLKEEIEAAIELEKESSWLPIWGQIKGFIMSSVSKIAFNLSRFGTVSLEDVESLGMKDNQLQIFQHGKNILESAYMYGKIGQYEVSLKPGESGMFNPEDVALFARRVNKIKPLYNDYLKSISALSE